MQMNTKGGNKMETKTYSNCIFGKNDSKMNKEVKSDERQ